MKNTITSCFLFIFLCTLLSCSNDDEGSNNQGIVVNGNNYNLDYGVIVDDGINSGGTHHELYFVISDAPVEITAIPNTLIGFEALNSSIAINFVLNSFGDSFEPGEYVYDENFGDNGTSYFYLEPIYIDGNGDNELNDPEDTILFINGGSIVVSGSLPDFVLDFNISLTNGETLEFRYDRGFDYIDNRG